MRKNIVIIFGIAIIILSAFFVSTKEKAQTTEPQNNETARNSNNKLLVKNLEKAGHFEVKNSGKTIKLNSMVVVEKQKDGEWKRLSDFEQVSSSYLDIRLNVGDGITYKESRCIKIRKNETIRPAAWTGYSCTAQAFKSCRGNVYLGPGKFRFVLKSCSGKNEYFGDEFELPKYKPVYEDIE